MQQILDRVQAIILRPRETWPIIKDEPATTGELYRNYIMILAAVQTLSMFIGMWIFGGAIFHRVGLSFFQGIAWAVVHYLFTLASVYIAAKVVESLAPTFDAKKDFISALKVVAYSWTPAFVIAVVHIIPGLSILTILGLYGLYLFYIGLPYLMECPPEKALPYAALSIIISLVIYMILSIVPALMVGFPSMNGSF
jgi:hypothetical protein